MLNDLISVAQQSPRKRQHLNIHQSYEDTCQRLFNAVGIDSYIRPHRHALDPKTETLFAVQGKFALVVFDDHGHPRQVDLFGTQLFGENIAAGVELSPGVWHTVVALTDHAILFEIKSGPFDPRVAKELAPWAPEEGTDQAASYLRSLRLQIAEYEPESS
jgi:cupin fold WbuC family metalloprotein